MIRRYCDQCGSELGPKNSTRERNRVSIDKYVGKPKVFLVTIAAEAYRADDRNRDVLDEDDTITRTPSDNLDLCLYCIIDAITTLDNRPKQADYSMPQDKLEGP